MKGKIQLGHGPARLAWASHENGILMYYTYVLLSEKDNKFYVGFTKDLKKRVLEHNKGLVPSTRYRGPLSLVYYEACLNEADALNREKHFKSGYGRRYLNKRLENYKKDVFN